MMHLIREDHQKDFCPYCKKEIDTSTWENVFHLDKIYKTAECKNCKKPISIKMGFSGSGHDEWRKIWEKVTIIKEKERQLIRLEDRVKVVNTEANRSEIKK